MKTIIKAAQEDEETETLTFDLQKTHPLPKLSTGISYYKRQLNLYNLGIFVGSSQKGIFNVWLENEAGRGTQEVGSYLRKFINENVNKPVQKLILWSDSCGGQNRSIKLVLILIHILQNHATLESISLKFLLSGHSFLPNDSHFGDVECALKYQQRLYTIDDYLEVMRNCRQKQKFLVNRMTRLDMISVSNMERAITNRKSDVNKENISWLKTHEILLKKDNPTTLYMRNHITETNFSEPNGKPISAEKAKDLKDILKLVPQDAKLFYAFLRSSETEDYDEDIEGLGPNIDFEIDESFLEDV
nr:unnamed protein product [Callosobruchus analis]